MCELAVKNSDWISVSTWEIEQKGFVDFPSVVVRHAEYLKTTLPKHTFEVIYLCGAGNKMFFCPFYVFVIHFIHLQTML